VPIEQAILSLAVAFRRQGEQGFGVGRFGWHGLYVLVLQMQAFRSQWIQGSRLSPSRRGRRLTPLSGGGPFLY
jgi:hypothetical protein